MRLQAQLRQQRLRLTALSSAEFQSGIDLTDEPGDALARAGRVEGYLIVELPVAAHRERAARLLEELNYMNLEEIRGFCSERGIPYRTMRLLRDLTAGRFKDGAVARVLAMEFWTRGEAPTFEEFARSWTKAKAEQHRMLTPEYAYLTDLKRHRADSTWKAFRTAKAKSALRTLARVAPV